MVHNIVILCHVDIIDIHFKISIFRLLYNFAHFFMNADYATDRYHKWQVWDHDKGKPTMCSKMDIKMGLS